jgi:hypothetical protein
MNKKRWKNEQKKKQIFILAFSKKNQIQECLNNFLTIKQLRSK